MELFTSRYMTRFRCLGTACEDDCCHEWRIYIDRAHHDRLRERMATPAEEAELAAGFELLDGGRDPRRHALAVLRDDGSCSFLASGLCSLHARHGEDSIPDVCATYPRTLGVIGDRLELVATPGCPEIARLVLLAEDGTERVPCDPALLGRGWVSHALDPGTRDPYETNFLPIRGLVLGLLRARRYPVASRLFFVAWFAQRMRGSLRRGAAAFDARGLQHLGQSLQVEANLDALHRQLATAPADPVDGLERVRALLCAPAVMGSVERLVQELAPLFAEHGAALDGPAGDLRRAWAALPPLPAELGARLDTILERFASHHLLRNWYVERVTFEGYVHELLLRVAAVRVLVGGLARRRGLGTLPALDALAVQVIYRLSRMLESADAQADPARAGLETTGTGLEHAVALLRV